MKDDLLADVEFSVRKEICLVYFFRDDPELRGGSPHSLEGSSDRMIGGNVTESVTGHSANRFTVNGHTGNPVAGIRGNGKRLVLSCFTLHARYSSHKCGPDRSGL